MPGAPNRPLPPDPTAAPPAPPPEEAGRAALRRLAPARVALNLDLWKGAPSPELVTPYAKAEAAFAAGDWANAQTALDALAVRFTEPRWPTMPKPFRDLRVAIPAPQPPQWDPEHALPAADKDAKRRRRDAELQLALADAAVAWLGGHGLASDDQGGDLATARTALGGEDLTDFWAAIDRIWSAVRARVPVPGGSRAPAPAPDPPA